MLDLPEIVPDVVYFINSETDQNKLLEDDLRNLGYKPDGDFYINYDDMIYIWNNNRGKYFSSISKKSYNSNYKNDMQYFHLNFLNIYYTYKIEDILSNLDKLEQKYK